MAKGCEVRAASPGRETQVPLSWLPRSEHTVATRFPSCHTGIIMAPTSAPGAVEERSKV